MLKNLQIKNLRIFKELDIPKLSRINLFAGKNNAGKTSLLEAVFLLCGAGNPHMALNANVNRGVAPAMPTTIPEVVWKTAYNLFNTSVPIEIRAEHSSAGVLTLKIILEKQSSMEISLDDPAANALVQKFPESRALAFFFRKDTAKEVIGRIQITAGGLRVDQPESEPPFMTVFLSSHSGNLQEDAIRLGQLRRQKKGDILVGPLKIVEPRLQSVEDNSSSGAPMIWGDIGLPELIPLPTMGEGMARIARLILAISYAPDGVVLVDEVENGLHHSVLNKVWDAIYETADQFNTQIIATTHSYECLKAAAKSRGADSLLVHRLERVNSEIRCTTYEPNETETAMSHGLEVR